MTYFDILRPPDSVMAQAESGWVGLRPAGDSWQAGDIAVETRRVADRLQVTIAAKQARLQRIRLRWLVQLQPDLRLLGDHWERGYGDLEWRGLVPERVMPWYFLAYEAAEPEGPAHGYGVRTGSAALCFWTVDASGVCLWLDVRNGGAGVELNGRSLVAAEVVARQGQAGETPFSAARALCRLLCDQPRLPAVPVYGSNNWYYAYGHGSHSSILNDARLLVSLTPLEAHRPYMVIDAGWQPEAGGPLGPISGGPYEGHNPLFPDMPGLAAAIRDIGARPGIWLRPLAAAPGERASLLLPVERALDKSAMIGVLDPSLPEVLERVQADCQMLRGWGYDLIKHDWTACDIFGRWGFQMGATLTNSGWHFADRSRTTGEIILALYRAIREGAGDAVVIGCNTIGHLSAGIFELQRTGDDTSGREWERTRKMGINTLAFRMPQHNTFFAADPDCVGHTAAMPWDRNRQFLDLVARSGAPLFVSIDPAEAGAEQKNALRAAYALAAQAQPPGEPLDWLHSTSPSTWRLGGEIVRYDWFGKDGVWPL